MRKRLILLLLVIVSIVACTNHKKTNERIITVTIEPLRYFTEQIAGDKFKVISMVPKGSNPETYDPTPQQLVSLNNSEAYFRIGYIGFEITWLDKLLSNVPQMKTFDTSKGIELIYGHHHHEETDHHHTHLGVEPHVWNSPQNALLIAANIKTALINLDSVNETYYTQRYDKLVKEICLVDQQVEEILHDADSSFMIYHPALSYFARDYGLRQISIEAEGKEPSPLQLKTLIDLSRQKGVNVIFVQQEFDSRNAALIAKETKSNIIAINPLNYNWKQELLNISQALKHHGKQ
ncbi:MAG: zinc ABC transporter substrate-binding protein [Bacteroidaceae bacterium]